MNGIIDTKIWKNKKVMLQCPNDHLLFPDGIKIGTLWSNFGLRLSEDQEIKRTGFVVETAISHEGQDQELVMQRLRNKVYLSTFKLSTGQFKLLHRVCPECKSEEPVTDGSSL